MARESDHAQKVETKCWPMSQHVVESKMLFDESNATSDWKVVTQVAAGDSARS